MLTACECSKLCRMHLCRAITPPSLQLTPKMSDPSCLTGMTPMSHTHANKTHTIPMGPATNQPNMSALNAHLQTCCRHRTNNQVLPSGDRSTQEQLCHAQIRNICSMTVESAMTSSRVLSDCAQLSIKNTMMETQASFLKVKDTH